MRGIQAELNSGPNAPIADTGKIIFNSVLNNQTSDITYSNTTGDFSITRAGNYLVTWWTSTSGGTGTTSNTVLSVAVNNNPVVAGASPIMPGQITGFALITVGAGTTTVSLVNTSGNEITLANIVPQASIMILEFNQ